MLPSMRRGKWYSAWCPLMESLLQERELNVVKFAEKVGEPHNNISQYLSGVVRPPLDKIEEWARVLELEDGRKQWFIRLAYIAHTHKYVNAEMELIRQEIKEGTKRLDAAETRLKNQSDYIETLKTLLRQNGVEPPAPGDKVR
jgi:transcriptional regulator with XRE-family HTH domain